MNAKLSMELDGRRVTRESMMGRLNHARRGLFCAFQSSALSHIKTRFDEQANILQPLLLKQIKREIDQTIKLRHLKTLADTAGRFSENKRQREQTTRKSKSHQMKRPDEKSQALVSCEIQYSYETTLLLLFAASADNLMWQTDDESA
jgi:hypothetical protein